MTESAFNKPPVPGAPGSKPDQYPAGGRQRTWRKPRLTDGQKHPVEVRKKP